jgi:hypothetical protein
MHPTKEEPMPQARGTFEVRLEPQAPGEIEEPTLGRMTIDKQFMGDLAGSSKGQMLSAMTGTEGSAGYVAIERVQGTLHGRAGSFVLQHSGTMDRGEGALVIAVVPDSGSDALTGLRGSMNIVIANGEHRYEFDYTLDETA